MKKRIEILKILLEEYVKDNDCETDLYHIGIANGMIFSLAIMEEDEMPKYITPKRKPRPPKVKPKPPQNTDDDDSLEAGLIGGIIGMGIGMGL